MKFLQTSAWASISTSISLLTKLATNKVVAFYLGTSGMFILGQVRDFLKITTAIGHLGTVNGTTKYVAQYKDDSINLNAYLGTSFRIHLFSSLATALVCILFSGKLSTFLFNSSNYNKVLILIAFSFVTISINSLLLSVLNGLKKVKIYVLITSISAIFSAIFLIILVHYFQLIGALYAIALNQFLVLIISTVIIALNKAIPLTLYKFSFSSTSFKNLSKFSLMALVSPFCLVAATLFVRHYVNNSFGENHAGSWEGMWRLSTMYLLFITTTFKFYLLPTYSQLEGNALRKEVFNTWKYVLPLMIALTLVIFLLKDFIINLLFTEEFILIGTLLGFHLLGDIIKMNTWVLGNLLIAKARTKAFIFFQIEWATVFILGTIIFGNKYGFKGVAIAYFVACCIHFTLMNIYLRNLLWTRNITSQN